MDNFGNKNTARRYIAHLSVIDTTQIQLRNPYIVAWWSAAFPGCGHLLLSKDIIGVMLFVWEFVVNVNANINLAIIYSFQGDINKVISVLDTRWLLIYTPVYFFAIWDSYQTTIGLNKTYLLADKEGHRINSFSINSFGINFLDKKNPFLAIMWSSFAPGLGYIYLRKGLLTASVGIFSTIIVFYYSNFLAAVTLLITGEITQATSILNPEWLLFLPSMYGFAMYGAYLGAVENNKLFEREQRSFLKDNYQDLDFLILKRKKAK